MITEGILLYHQLTNFVTMRSKGCFIGNSRRILSQECEYSLKEPLLPNQPKRKVKSRDDAYSTDVGLFNQENHVEYYGV